MILIGSKYFFGRYPGFHSHDTDYVDVVDTNEFKEKRVIRGQGKDMFILKKKPKEHLIQDALKSELPMVVGKFLVPEFNKLIGFTIADLPKLLPQFEKLDEKHQYEKIIYDAYIENNSFTLTDEQRDAAYASYKETRK